MSIGVHQIAQIDQHLHHLQPLGQFAAHLFAPLCCFWCRGASRERTMKSGGPNEWAVHETFRPAEPESECLKERLVEFIFCAAVCCGIVAQQEASKLWSWFQGAFWSWSLQDVLMSYLFQDHVLTALSVHKNLRELYWLLCVWLAHMARRFNHLWWTGHAKRTKTQSSCLVFSSFIYSVLASLSSYNINSFPLFASFPSFSF